jgi:hypothetical protein
MANSRPRAKSQKARSNPVPTAMRIESCFRIRKPQIRFIPPYIVCIHHIFNIFCYYFKLCQPGDRVGAEITDFGAIDSPQGAAKLRTASPPRRLPWAKGILKNHYGQGGEGASF